MTASRERLSDVDRQLAELGSDALVERGRAAAPRLALAALDRLDAELEGLAGGLPVRSQAVAAPASALDAGSLFDDMKLSEAPAGSMLADLVRSVEPKNAGETRIPAGREGAIDLAELLEGDSELPPPEPDLFSDDE